MERRKSPASESGAKGKNHSQVKEVIRSAERLRERGTEPKKIKDTVQFRIDLFRENDLYERQDS